MSDQKKHVILIGMPASGKSTVGVLAAKELGCRFLDSDQVIQMQQGRTLHELIDSEHNEGFLRIEEQTNLTLGCEEEPTIIATGGSAIYSERAMAHFKEVGTVVYLELSYETVKRRLGDFALRGVIVPEGFTLKDLYDQRIAICRRWADLTLHQDDGDSIEEAAHRLCTALRQAGLF